MEVTENQTLTKSKIFKQYLVAICVSLSGLCVGTVLSWTAPVLPQLVEQNIITKNEEGMLGSVLAVGAIISAIPAGYLSDIIGRKKASLCIMIPFTMGWILIITVNDLSALYVARFLLGISISAVCVCTPIYIGEIAEASIRGVIGAFFPIQTNLGILCTGTLNLFLNWKWLTIGLSFWTILYSLVLFAIPETPTYLLKIGRIDQARNVLKILRGENYANLEKELQETDIAIKVANQQKFSFKKSLSSSANRRALIAGSGILAFQQLIGITAITFYTVTIFESAGSALSPNIATVIVNVTQVLAACLPLLLAERANRKFYLKVSGIGSAICLAILGIYFHLIRYNIKVIGLNTLPVISLVLYILFFSIGFGNYPWIIIGEIFSPEIKAFGTGLAITSCWLSAFIVTFCFPLIGNNLGGHVAFYIFAVTSIMGTLFVEFFVPETKGKTLQEIQELLDH